MKTVAQFALWLAALAIPGCGGVEFQRTFSLHDSPRPVGLPAVVPVRAVLAVDPSIIAPKPIPEAGEAVAEVFIWPYRILILPKH